MTPSKLFLSLFGAAAIAISPFSIDLHGVANGAAHAKNGSDNGGGNGGNGNGGGNGGGNGKGGGHSADKSTKSEKSSSARSSGERSSKQKSASKSVGKKSAVVASTTRPKQKSDLVKIKAGNGALASELKWLNAAHANPNAFLNADPESNVGRIGAYREAVLAAQTAQQDYDDALAEALRLGSLTEEEIAAAYPDADGINSAAYEQALADAALAVDPAELERLAGLTEEELAAEFPAAYDAEAYALAVEQADAKALSEEGDLAATDGLIESTLETAARGATLSPAALDYFHELLGLPKPEVAAVEIIEEVVTEVTNP